MSLRWSVCRSATPWRTSKYSVLKAYFRPWPPPICDDKVTLEYMFCNARPEAKTVEPCLHNDAYNCALSSLCESVTNLFRLNFVASSSELLCCIWCQNEVKNNWKIWKKNLFKNFFLKYQHFKLHLNFLSAYIIADRWAGAYNPNPYLSPYTQW